MSSNEWSFEKNSFDIIRLISALFIILGHIATHLQYQPPNLIMTIQQRWIGLFTLFVMTGFFIPSSIERSKNAKTYFAKRVSRIYPALLAAFVVSLVAVLTFGVHIQKIKVSMGTLVTWIISQVTVFQFYTPSELTLYGVGNPNGSLWTISMELQVYVLLYLIYGWLKR